jgi:propanol-preferring alcohol dehydrogenase
MASIPSHQQAAVVEDPGDNFKIVLRNDIHIGEPGPEEILVKLTCTGLW